MTDPTEPDPVTVDQAEAILDRLAYRDDAQSAAYPLPAQTGQDTSPDLVPRSVKLTAELDRACKERAIGLGLSQSAYTRSLIERDLAQAAGTDRPVMMSDLQRLLSALGSAA